MAAGRNKRKHRRGRGLLASLLKLLCALAVIGALTVGATVFFQVETVAVVGSERYTQEEVASASSVQVGDNLFRLNKAAIRDRIEEELPYVESVDIRRSLPSTLVITVRECSAVAAVQAANQSWLISENGKLLEKGNGGDAVLAVTGLIPVVPREGTPLAVELEEQARLDGLLDFLQAMQSLEMSGEVSDVSLTSTRLLLRYRERYDVKLPLTCDFGYKLELLRAAANEQEKRMGADIAGTFDLTREDFSAIYTPAEEKKP